MLMLAKKLQELSHHEGEANHALGRVLVHFAASVIHLIDAIGCLD